MRLSVVHDATPNAHYRAQLPMLSLQQRGHTVEPFDPSRCDDANWDAVHIYRVVEPSTLAQAERLRERGISVVFDIDDDLDALASEMPGFLAGRRRRFIRGVYARSVELARVATTMTTPSETIAARYRELGVEHVTVVENYVGPRSVVPSRPRRTGVTIGCVAGREHAADFKRLRLAQTLRTVLERHPQVRVVTVGVDLGLRHPRYTYRIWVPVDRLVEHGRAFDIGFAPLVDSPFNRARSTVKLKEYAAAGTPWLASPVGPYRELGEREGGELVTDDGWLDAFDRLVTDYSRRRELAANARRWADSQSLSVAGDRWELVYRQAIARTRRTARHDHGRR